VLGLFGALAVAAVVLVLQSPDKFKTSFAGIGPQAYFTDVVTLLSLVAVLSIVGSVASAFVAAGLTFKPLVRFTSFITGVALAALAMSLPLLLLPTDMVAAQIVAVVGIGSVIVFFALMLLAPSVAHQTTAPNSRES
jgi:hypothetical protein